ncbi:MAG TPA: hypothetical protein VIE65_02145 [Methylobacter sp.]|jgi:hypothetical protein
MESKGPDPRDINLIDEMIGKITDKQIKEILEELARREVELLLDSRISSTPDLKEVSMWNIAALCAASNKIKS